MYKRAETPKSMGFLLNPNSPNAPLTLDNVVILETSRIPFTSGISIGHADYQTYVTTSDFLMVSDLSGFTLVEFMARSGSTYTTGPIGPKLRQILGILG